MCGICGVFTFDGSPVDREMISRMGSCIRHRGPDGDGCYVSNGIGLGHRRLSIIDIDGGAQPIASDDGNLQLIFNGEIYNFIELRDELKKKGHIFKTRSDTEVILRSYEEWGLECVTFFNGIFAFALWDGTRKRLLLARDHLGVKPLYYALLANRLLFASEVKSLLADHDCPRAVDVTSLATLFTLRYVPSPSTMFEGINKVPPGHIMTVSAEGCAVQRYWNWKPEIGYGADEQSLVEQYQSLLHDAVRLQMRSDVPVGLFLSSGVDSGALLAIMSQHSGRPVPTFTIGFEGGESSNETDDARQIAERFGTNHSELIIGAKDYEQYYERYMWDIEEPVGNETAAAFYFVSHIASKQVKVALTGQGADEPWAGYNRYLGVKFSGAYSRLPKLLSQHIVGNVVEKLARSPSLKRSAASLHERDELTRFVKIYSFYTQSMKQSLFQPWLQNHVSTDGTEARAALRQLQADVQQLDPLTQMLYIDTRANLPDDLLMVADKTAMANSLEARVPFLDKRLVEFIETLPPNLKLRGLQGKYLHKKALEKWLPKKAVHRKKKGFANPIGKWLRTTMRGFAGACLLSEQAAVNQYFEPSYIKALMAAHDAGRQDHLRHIYLLMSFELWHQAFISR